MIWDRFIYFAVVALLCWAVGAVFAWKGKAKPAIGLTLVGIGVFLAYILMMWIELERTMVLAVLADGRTFHLQSLALQVDIDFLHRHDHRVYLHQPLQA